MGKYFIIILTGLLFIKGSAASNTIYLICDEIKNCIQWTLIQINNYHQEFIWLNAIHKNDSFEVFIDKQMAMISDFVLNDSIYKKSVQDCKITRIPAFSINDIILNENMDNISEAVLMNLVV